MEEKNFHFLVYYQLLKLNSMQEKDTFFSTMMTNPVKTWRMLSLKFHIK